MARKTAIFLRKTNSEQRCFSLTLQNNVPIMSQMNVLSCPDIANLTGFSRRTILRWAVAGQIPERDHNHDGRQIRFRDTGLLRDWIKKNQCHASARGKLGRKPKNLGPVALAQAVDKAESARRRVEFIEAAKRFSDALASEIQSLDGWTRGEQTKLCKALAPLARFTSPPPAAR
jgi:hypothetical protein